MIITLGVNYKTETTHLTSVSVLLYPHLPVKDFGNCSNLIGNNLLAADANSSSAGEFLKKRKKEDVIFCPE